MECSPLNTCSILLHLFRDKDTGWLSQHNNYNFLYDAPPMITQHHLPEPILAGKGNQEAIRGQNAAKLLNKCTIESNVCFMRTNLFAKGQIGDNTCHACCI